MSLAPMYYRSAEIIILVFDVTREESFKSLGKWMEALQSNQRGGSFIVLAGNKIDMQERVIGRDEINAFCAELPRYKRPRRIIFADVPRNPTGKIEKPRLREIYCGKRLVEAQTTK